MGGAEGEGCCFATTGAGFSLTGTGAVGTTDDGACIDAVVATGEGDCDDGVLAPAGEAGVVATTDDGAVVTGAVGTTDDGADDDAAAGEEAFCATAPGVADSATATYL